MSELEDSIRNIVREVIREEFASLVADKSDELLRAEDVRVRLNFNNVQKVYSLVRQGQLEAIWISEREMRFTPEAVRDFKLKGGIKAA